MRRRDVELDGLLTCAYCIDYRLVMGIAVPVKFMHFIMWLSSDLPSLHHVFAVREEITRSDITRNIIMYK